MNGLKKSAANKRSMKTEVELGAHFNRDFHRLSRKYRTLLAQIIPIVARLGAGEKPGDRIAGTKREVYKVRLGNPAARRGKSGGFRLIYLVRSANNIVLLNIYSKSDRDTITPAKIRRMIADLG